MWDSILVRWVFGVVNKMCDALIRNTNQLHFFLFFSNIWSGRNFLFLLRPTYFEERWKRFVELQNLLCIWPCLSYDVLVCSLRFWQVGNWGYYYSREDWPRWSPGQSSTRDHSVSSLASKPPPSPRPWGLCPNLINEWHSLAVSCIL